MASAGDVIGTAGIWSEFQGRTEVQINNYNDYNDYAICSYALLDDALKPDSSNRLAAMYADFEPVIDSNIYDEASFAMPACLFESFCNP